MSETTLCELCINYVPNSEYPCLRSSIRHIKAPLPDDLDDAKLICEKFKMSQAEEIKQRDKLIRDIIHWIPCPRYCGTCERFRYPEGCEFAIRAKELGVSP